MNMKKLFAIFFSIVLTTLVQAQSDPNNDGSTSNRKTVDTSSVIVQLNGDPLSTYVKTKPPQGKKIDFNSKSTKSYRAQLSALRNDFKQWLQTNAPKAKITGQYDISLNAVAVQLNGTAKSTIEQAPQAKYVEYELFYYPNVVPTCGPDPDLGLINAIAAWSENGAGGSSNAGAGVKVAIIDTGIDLTHPCFCDTGYPNTPQIGDTNFTNNKVIAAKVFNNNAGVKGYTPEAIQDHGTHVAGTVGCDFQTPATVNGVTIPYCPSGVAPKVFLGNYNVFPADVDNARSEDILNALEAAYADGFDIANMSLGGSHGKSGNVGFNDLLMNAVNDLDQAGFISAIAAGNSGPGFNTVESPGAAERALTAGAVTVGQYIGVNVEDNTDPANFAAAVGEFGPSADQAGTLSANLGTFCGTQSVNLTGKIALIDRGVCTFSEKIRNAQTNGAVGAIIVNNVCGPPISMAQDGTPNQPTIPAVMVSNSDRTALGADTGDTFTIHSAASYVFNAADNDVLAGFSSRGPTDVDFRVKPDVTAPGVNVLSSIPLSFCQLGPQSNCGPDSCWAFFQGTSMATPHLAGSAAIVLQQHPTWSAAQVRSAIVNTADSAVKNPTGCASLTDGNAVGSGRENLDKAVLSKVALDPVSVSFGAVPSGSGQTKAFNVTLTNLDSSSHNFSLVLTSSTGTGVSYSLSSSSTGSLAGGASANVTVTMTAAKGASPGSHQATLNVSDGGILAHAVVFTFSK
jgi:minor extracellular serine protease Vpr